MPRIEFTPHLKMHLDCPAQQVNGSTVRDALEAVFVTNPKLRGYVTDDQNRLRKHVVIFVDGQTISDRVTLSDLVKEESEIFVMQALSGG